MAHHSSGPDPEMARRMREIFGERMSPRSPIEEQMLGEPVPMRLDTHTQGKLTARDEGDLVFRVGDKDGKVVMEFHEPLAWVGMTPEQAVSLAQSLIKRACRITEHPLKVSL